MRENIRMFREWYRVCKPNKAYWFFQFATVIVVSICIVCESMYVAKVTTSLAEGNFKLAIFCLTLGLLFVLFRQCAWILNYNNMKNLIGDIYSRLQLQIYRKIIHGKERNFEIISKEKLINIFHSDAYETAKFSDQVCDRFRYFLSTLLTLAYVFSVSIPIGIVILIVILINYKILNIINDRISIAVKDTKEAVDFEFEIFSEIITSKNMIDSYDLTKKMEKEFVDANNNFLKQQHKKNMANSMLENNFFGYYKVIIYVITLFLIYFLSKGNLTLTIYLVVVSYLTDSITNSKDFLVILKELKSAYVTCNRVQIILDFKEKDEKIFGNIQKNDIAGEIIFTHVSYDATKMDDFPTNDIKDVSFHILPGQIVLFHGTRSSGKRTIFYLLRRVIFADKGKIYVDQFKIEDYSEKIYRRNVNYLTTKPFFYQGSIWRNLKLVCSDRKKVRSVLEQVGIYDSLMELPKKLNSSVNVLSKKEQYLLGLARLLLMDTEIIVLYEFPNYLSNRDKEIIKNVLKNFGGKKTIIMFSANEDISDISDRVFEVEKGEVFEKEK